MIERPIGQNTRVKKTKLNRKYELKLEIEFIDFFSHFFSFLCTPNVQCPAPLLAVCFC